MRQESELLAGLLQTQPDDCESALPASHDSEAVAESSRSPDEKSAEPREEVEYQTPPAVKYTWLAIYFLLSLFLTIYNKLVLGVVRALLPQLYPAIRVHLLTVLCPLVSVPMASDVYPRRLRIRWHLCVAAAGLF